MDNLSGGEKTVAALALLFSIHRYNVQCTCICSLCCCMYMYMYAIFVDENSCA